jgi:hypothetical protein
MHFGLKTSVITMDKQEALDFAVAAIERGNITGSVRISGNKPG